MFVERSLLNNDILHPFALQKGQFRKTKRIEGSACLDYLPWESLGKKSLDQEPKIQDDDDDDDVISINCSCIGVCQNIIDILDHMAGAWCLVMFPRTLKTIRKHGKELSERSS